MAAKKILFIEGEPNTDNGDLRQGFSKLLEKKLKGKLPRIKLGGGKTGTIDKYLNNRHDGEPLLLIDLDKQEEYRQNDLNEHGLTEHSTTVFYMVQEMESWFLSQPSILDEYYGTTNSGKKVSEILSNKKPHEIADPKGEFKRITQALNKGEKYHEIKHSVELLKNLDASKPENDFPDFKRLIESLK